MSCLWWRRSEIMRAALPLLFLALRMRFQIDIVLIGAHAVMANGGIIAPLGSHTVALAAQKHGVSVVVLAGLHKVCRQVSQSIDR